MKQRPRRDRGRTIRFLVVAVNGRSVIRALINPFNRGGIARGSACHPVVVQRPLWCLIDIATDELQAERPAGMRRVASRAPLAGALAPFPLPALF